MMKYFLVIMVLILCIVFTGCVKEITVPFPNIIITPEPTPEPVTLGMTLEAFISIEEGMTYDDVATILGKQGTITSSYGDNEAYIWVTETSVVSIIFSKGEVIVKTQAGLS